ncbi:phosphate starvation-inducible PhoH-like protein [Scopulibacillus darangshiensis]|uniref:PhoH-like protein n=1 Tax=Scopulibacillus darangshiensis TaxID=442528 RepID=A0A4V2SNT0_9BACL|nr:PhoH family protein [Scopulibacillus darangshiensis]TCP32346.1 phosphate starvation-inducible PhoH-like protein [Scopulibacillus darangshiensis]
MPADLYTIDIELDNANEALALFGPGDANLKVIEDTLTVSIVTRGGAVSVSGNEETLRKVESILNALLDLIRRGIHITERDVVYALKLADEGLIEELAELYEGEITVNAKGKPIRVKTLGQRKYVNAMNKHDMVFAIGPAGTGKTYLAVVKAVSALKAGIIKRIVLTRPAVEAGESLGFLPGDLKEKVDPYLRPLYDALHDVLGAEHTLRLIERGTIEIAPLAYMRGRTLEDAYVILDEAQNTTPEQMKMFLTRLGFGSKMIVTGDITQVDLPKGKHSGLKTAKDMLDNIPGIAFIQLDRVDVVRHPLVQKIIEAYES